MTHLLRRRQPCAQLASPVLLLAVFLAGLTTARSGAQALPTATKSADLSVFVGYATTQPDYGPYRNSGGTLGLDLTRYFHFPVAPSFELRANFANGTTVNERSYLIGVRARADFLRAVHPYVDFLAGPGNIHFNFPNGYYTGDNSVVYSYGGGIDYDLVNNFAAKVDFQAQHWNLGQNNTLAPSLLLFGFSYRFPFEPHNRQDDLGR